MNLCLSVRLGQDEKPEGRSGAARAGGRLVRRASSPRCPERGPEVLSSHAEPAATLGDLNNESFRTGIDAGA